MNDLASQLRERGFDCKAWNTSTGWGGISTIQITDIATAATVYMRDTATLEQCLEAIDNKNLAFRLADNNK